MRGVWVEWLIAGSVYKKGGGVNIQIRKRNDKTPF